MWQVFVAEVLESSQASLRRYASGSVCPGNPHGTSYHNAQSEPLPDGWPRDKATPASKECACDRCMPPGYPLSDPRWPTHCACGYEFKNGTNSDADSLQLFVKTLYRDTRDGQIYTIKTLPVGAMFRIHLYEDDTSWCGSDKMSYALMCPGGSRPEPQMWAIDVRTGSDGWKRTGTVPRTVSVTPSILFTYPGGFHGYLLNGVLYDYDRDKIPPEAWIQNP